jgi:hypothetical protein
MMKVPLISPEEEEYLRTYRKFGKWIPFIWAELDEYHRWVEEAKKCDECRRMFDDFR